ncbi:MAG: MFS transporter [Spirochaetota bacterium]
MSKSHTIFRYLSLLGGSYLLMFFSGSFTSIRGTLLPMIMDHFNISYSAGGLMFLCVIVPGMLGSLSAGYLFSHFNKKLVLIGGVSIIGVSTALMPISPGYVFFLACTVIFSYGLTMTITSGNITTSDIFDAVLPKYKENGINMVHFAFSIGALIPLFLLSIPAAWPGGWQPPFIMLSFVPLLILGLISVSRYPDVEKERTVPGRREYVRALADPQLRRYLLIVICYAGTEAGLVNWLPTYIQDARHLGTAAASRVMLLFFVFFTGGRFIGTMVIQKFNRHRLFLFLAVMMAVCLSGSLVFHIMPFGIELLLPVSGFFFALVFPIFQMNLIEDFRHMLGSATSLLFTSSTAGITIVPFLIGVGNDIFGVQNGLLLTLATTAAMFPLYFGILRHKRKHVRSLEPAITTV